MATKAMLHVRVDETVKAQAAETLAAMGLSLSDAVRVFLTRIAAETRSAMQEAEDIAATRRARFSNAAELFESLEETDGSQ